jgi:hypothetical protein
MQEKWQGQVDADEWEECTWEDGEEEEEEGEEGEEEEEDEEDVSTDSSDGESHNDCYVLHLAAAIEVQVLQGNT